MEFSRKEYWSGVPFPASRDLPDPGIEPTSPKSPALADGFFTTVSSGRSKDRYHSFIKMCNDIMFIVLSSMAAPIVVLL